MTLYIFAHKSTIPTAKALRDSIKVLSLHFVDRILVTSRIDVIRKQGKILINWGRSDAPEDLFLMENLTINHPNIVSNTSRRLYQEDIGVRHIIWHPRSDESYYNYGRVVVRDGFYHGGRTVRFVDAEYIDEVDFNYWSPYIDFVSEYRILIFSHPSIGTIWRVLKKFPLEENEIVLNQERIEYKALYRPRIKGLNEFIDTIVDYYSNITDRGFFLGLDVGRDQDNNLWLIEPNSAPGLNSISLAFFATTFLYTLHKIQN